MRGAANTLVAVAVLVVGCGDDAPRGDLPVVEGVSVPDGFSVTEVAAGLVGPTQIAFDPSNRLIVAELNGTEGGDTGRVVAVDLADPQRREVLVDDLVTPTGVAVAGDLLWVMEQRRLSVGPLAGGDRQVVLDDLPYNGRSEGTLTNAVGGGILYDTSGSRDPGAPAELKPGSGTLWRLSSPDAEPEPLATGFKHAYAHTYDATGQLWSTEMSDGRLDGEVPPDELVAVTAGDDFGYPRCVGDNLPVAELDADDETCAGAPHSHALFDAGSTPTSVAVAPWDPDTLLVALWNAGLIVSVPRDPVDAPYTGTVFLEGVAHPQHLLADGDRLLVVDFDGGRVLAVTPSA